MGGVTIERASERAVLTHPPAIPLRSVLSWTGGPGGTGREGTKDRRAGATPRVGAGGASGPPTQSATRLVVSAGSFDLVEVASSRRAEWPAGG
eukprot:6173231-Pleurochrysis_carterae.AAC.1